MSKISLSDEAGGPGQVDAISAIYSRIRDDAQRRRKDTYGWADLVALTGQDFSVIALPLCLLFCKLQSSQNSSLICGDFRSHFKRAQGDAALQCPLTE